MKVLLVTNMYPTQEMPYFGIFVKEQMDSLKYFYPDIQFDLYFIEGGGVLGGGPFKSLKNYFKSIYEINRKIKSEKYHLVHIHYGLAGLFMLNPFRRRVPTILTLHGGDILKEQNGSWEVQITKQVIKRVSYTISLNERMYNIVQGYGCETSIIPCAVDTTLFCPKESEHKKNSRLIVFPSSRTRTVKNYKLFEDTIAILKNKYQINCNISEVHNMSRTEISSLFQRADLLLMTSISEGSPQAVKEAMACNLPVVSTPVGDVNYLLDGVKNSFVSKEHNSEELAFLCYESLNNKKEGISGYDRIQVLGLDNKNVTDRIYQIYRRYCKNY